MIVEYGIIMLTVVVCALIVFLIFAMLFFKNLSIKVEIAEKTMQSFTESNSDYKDPFFDENGDSKQKEEQATIDTVMEAVNKIMLGEEVVEGGEKVDG